MNVKITGKNIEITDGIKEKVYNCLNKSVKFIDENDTVNVLIRTVKNDQIIEITTINKGKPVRVERRDKDLYTAIDEIEDTLERKLRKIKEKTIDTHRYSKNETINTYADTNTDIPDIIRRKNMILNIMTEDEAIEQMYLTDHNFYIFRNPDDIVTVVYLRDDGGYGIIEEIS